MQDLALGLVELHEIHTGPTLKPSSHNSSHLINMFFIFSFLV